MHNMEQYWEKPEELQPTRFLPENEAKIVAGSYLPLEFYRKPGVNINTQHPLGIPLCPVPRALQQ